MSYCLVLELKGAEQVKAVFDKFINSTVVSSGCINLHGVLLIILHFMCRRVVKNLLNLVGN